MRRLFGMKLDAEDASLPLRALDRGRERAAVVGAGDLVRRIDSGVGVDEVEDLLLDASEERSARGDAVPADLRHRQRPVELLHLAAHQAEAVRRAHLVRYVEEELMADADAEERSAAVDRGANGVV